MSRVYYKGAMGALVVFDITKSSTLEAASEWKQDLNSKVCLDGGCPVPAVLLANKCDMKGRDRDLVSSLDGFCKDNSFTAWFETSAKVCVVFYYVRIKSVRLSSEVLLTEVGKQEGPGFDSPQSKDMYIM